MDQQIFTALAVSRNSKIYFKGLMDEAIAELKKSESFQELQRFYEQAVKAEEELNAEIKAEALKVYQADPTKKKQGPVTIKIFTVAKIEDKEKARAWCIDNFTPALTLDEKVFLSVAKTVPQDLISITEEPRAQIATDLSEYMLPPESEG